MTKKTEKDYDQHSLQWHIYFHKEYNDSFIAMNESVFFDHEIQQLPNMSEFVGMAERRERARHNYYDLGRLKTDNKVVKKFLTKQQEKFKKEEALLTERMVEWVDIHGYALYKFWADACAITFTRLGREEDD